MKHLKLFESFEDIDSICKKYGIDNYTINSDGSIDVDGDVELYNKGLTSKIYNLYYVKLYKLPLKFGKVTGDFYCYNNKLTTLEGAPKEVGGGFYCSHNQLITLEGCPMEVGGNFNCRDNKLTILEGAPREVGGYFYCNNNKLITLEGGPREVGDNFVCNYNQLTTLEGGPIKVGGDFYCNNNKLITLEGGPREVGGDFYCRNNPITSVYNLFPDYKSFMDSLDYNYIRGTDIVKLRFQEALNEIGIKLPEKIKGYNYI